MEAVAMRVGLVELGDVRDGDGVSLVALIDGWCAELMRFYRELDVLFGGSGDFYGVFDLVAAYSGRDRIASLLPAGFLFPHALCLADDFLRLFTAEVGSGWVGSIGQEAGTGWWWACLPAKGPVVEELRAWGHPIQL